MTLDQRFSPARVAFTSLWLVCLMATTNWVFNRFVLYHSQNRVLQPSDYTVTVVPATSSAVADAKLTDDGRFAVKVMTVGTSHAMDQVTNSQLPTISIGVLGLGSSLYLARGRQRQSLSAAVV